jgi:hypothetical protein
MQKEAKKQNPGRKARRLHPDKDARLESFRFDADRLEYKY